MTSNLLSELKPHPKNPNHHSDEQIERLAKLIEYQGFRIPIIVSKRSGFIVSGHGRRLAALKIGLKEVPVIHQDFESEEQEYAFLVSDNSIASWAELQIPEIAEIVKDFEEFDLDLLGFKDFQIVEAKELNDEDAVPEKVDPKTKPGDLYILGNHRLLCGDATNIQHVERLMDGQKADMVFTDPPYGISVKMDNSKGNNPLTKVGIMGDETAEVAVESFDICAAMQIPMIFFGANHYCFDAKLPNSKCWIAWNKQESNNHLDHADCELAWTNINSPARQFHHLWSGFRRDSEKGEQRVHPTQKPVKLIEEILDHFAAKVIGKKIIDLFGGSGSTLIACEKTNRKCFMMELDPHYCDVIVARWEKYTGKKAELAQ